MTVHVKGRTECYECQPKPAPKTYPVCTITSTPSKVLTHALFFNYIQAGFSSQNGEMIWTIISPTLLFLFFALKCYWSTGRSTLEN